MIVQVSAVGITLRNVPKVAVNQLAFWGFKKDPDTYYSAQSDKVDILLEKIIDYFDGEGITYELSSEAQSLLIVRANSKEAFGKTRGELNRLKGGDFDKAEYGVFEQFLANNLSRTLKDHQKKSAFHLYKAKHGANFSAPGSGKTSVVLSVYEKLKQEGLVDTLFVIGPPSSFGPWKREFESTLGRKAESKVLAGGDKEQRSIEYYATSRTKSELYLSTYQTVLRDQEEVIHLLSAKHIKAFLVVDEAHYMKRLNGNWAKAVLRLAESAVIRCVLTGTPMPRSYSDLFNLFDFLWPNHKPISVDMQNKILLLEKDRNYEEIKQLLDSTIGPLFYRVRKKDLRLTEQVFHPPVTIKMNPYERQIYEAIEHRIRTQDTLDDVHDIELVLHLRKGRLMRLRQAASYIKLLESAISGYQEVLYDPESDIGKSIHDYDKLEKPAKLEYLVSFIKKLREKNEKVLIWSNFLGTIDKIVETCEQYDWRVEQITGATPIENESPSEAMTRERIRNEFVDPSSGLDILVANPAACAESISLHTGCHNAVYYDLSYNCAQYLQSLDRIHRVGGSETVEAHYHFLEYEDSIDIDIKLDLERKAQRMYALIDQDYPIYTFDIEEEDDVHAYDRIIKNN